MMMWAACAAVVIAISGCGASAGAGSTPASSPTQPPTFTPPPTSVPTPNLNAAAQEYLRAFNALIAAEDPLIAQQNGQSAGAALGQTLNARVALRQQFDAAVAAIDAASLPNIAQDLHGVLVADAALEDALGALAANSDNAGTYTSLFPRYTAAGEQFSAATALATRDLGLVKTTPTPLP
ncbi:MAG: hypothetical protein NVSMB29_04760 [Candidatus Dormibacteria bacterium]